MGSNPSAGIIKGDKMKFLLHLLNIEALACVVVGLWIHSFVLILAGLLCFAVAPMIKNEISV